MRIILNRLWEFFLYVICFILLFTSTYEVLFTLLYKFEWNKLIYSLITMIVPIAWIIIRLSNKRIQDSMVNNLNKIQGA